MKISNSEFAKQVRFATDNILRIAAAGVAAEGGELPAPNTLEEWKAQPSLATPVGAKIIPSGFELGPKSIANLRGVKAKLIEVVGLAIVYTTQDFTVYEGLRSRDRQRKLVNQGASQTMESRHLEQPDGDGWAVDLVPWINGIPKWDWEGCYKIAYAMDQAATQLGVAKNIRWGGAWDRRLSDFGGSLELYKREVELYAQRHPGKDFLDGPHFEWIV